MAKPFSLQPLLDLMQTRTDEAARRLGQLIAAEQSQKSRLKLLEEYREEYNQRFRESSLAGMTPLAWRNFLDFLGRIDEAIIQQRLIVANSERDTTQGQDQWREQNKRLKAIDTLSDRHTASERYFEGKQEQKLQDEFSARKKGRETKE
ncbi:MAG: Flagellar FliJ protein [Betaproteobacteria bacterium ADurb.Bin341]|nr:MAG: Flagellar FliJ protein [Betaproteobacteria bacterium ADurb.Bin341]